MGFIIINAAIFLYQVSLGAHVEPFIQRHGLIPLHFMHFNQFDGGFTGNTLFPLFSSIFMHGGWLHIVGNMWFLWIFGDNVEDRLGHFKFFVFYLLCGIGASLIHVFADPTSQIPTIGASGAISGVLGAYLVSFPHARVHTLFIIFVIIRFIEVPAYLFLGIWFLFQIVSGAGQGAAYGQQAGVAWWAHIGGFVVGVVLVWLMGKRSGHRDLSQDVGYWH
jgi:membrane associated rhomboid family serine protease